MQTASPAIFVLHPPQPAAGAPALRPQLQSFALEYAVEELPDAAGCAPLALEEKYGPGVLHPVKNPYQTMSAAAVARIPAYCRIFRRMEEQGIEIACILEEGQTLDKDFPALLRAPETLDGDWDVLVLGRSGPPPRAARCRRKTRLFGSWRMAQPTDAQFAMSGCLVRRQTAQSLAALALPVLQPLEQSLQTAAQQRRMRLRFLQPAIARRAAAPEEKAAAAEEAETMEAAWDDFLSSTYSEECADFLRRSRIPAPPAAPWRGLRTRLARCLRPAAGRRPAPAIAPPPPAPTASGSDAWKVAVVIPLFNRGPLIVPTLKNLERQTRAPQRLIVVDDASTDDSAREVREYFAGTELPFAAELIVQPQNRGASAARNAGLQRAADCDFVYFLDSDDFPPRDFLQRAVARLGQEPEAVAASCDRVMHEGRRTVLESSRGLPANPWRWFLLNGAGIASVTLFRRSALDRAGSFDENLPTGHDVELFHRLANCGRWLHLPGAPGMMTRLPQQNNLFKNYAADHYRRWTYIWEDCLYRQRGKPHIEEPTEHIFAERWRYSGVILCREKRFAEANECFRRSLACGFSLRSLLYLKAPGLPSALLVKDQTATLIRRLLLRAFRAAAAAPPPPPPTPVSRSP